MSIVANEVLMALSIIILMFFAGVFGLWLFVYFLSYLSDCGERRGVFTQTVIGIIVSAAFITFLLTILLTIIGFVFS